jgi:hypothetical protein
MSKCMTCKTDEAIWAWQPFGPADDANTFATLGNHYRGFTVVKVCNNCRETIRSGSPVEFTCKGQRFIGNSAEVISVPDYVGDALLYWEESAPSRNPIYHRRRSVR